MRTKARWNDTDKLRTHTDTGSALAVVIWKAAKSLVLNLENEGFDTAGNVERMDMIAEVAAFAIHLADRTVYDRLDEDQREALVGAMAGRLVGLMVENRRDLQGPGEYQEPFLALINQRGAEYAGMSWAGDDGPGFVMKRNFGNNLAGVMSSREVKWVPDFVLDAETPRLLGALRKALRGLVAA